MISWSHRKWASHVYRDHNREEEKEQTEIRPKKNYLPKTDFNRVTMHMIVCVGLHASTIRVYYIAPGHSIMR